MLKKAVKRNYRKTKYILYKETLIDYKEIFLSFLGSFLGLSIISYIHFNFFNSEDIVLLIGSFGATCVLIYGAIQSPLAQPRNLIGGHLISAFIGVSIYKIFPDTLWLSASLAVALSIVFMQITKTLHPPGGATALIAVIGSPAIKNLGYTYMVVPVLSGVLILLFVALVVNNLTKNRQYPTNNRFTKFKRKYLKK